MFLGHEANQKMRRVVKEEEEGRRRETERNYEYLPGFIRNWVDDGTKGKEVGRRFLEENKNCLLDLFV